VIGISREAIATWYKLVWSHGRRESDATSILTLNKLGDAIADSGNTSAGTVSTDRADLAQEELGTFDDIGLVAKVLGKSLLVLKQQRVFKKTGDLSEEGDGLLIELLGVADVCGNDLFERKIVGIALCDLGSVFLGLDGKFTTDGVLGSDDALVNVL
jgi:hypothetical protein